MEVVHIAAVGDIHCNRNSAGVLRNLFLRMQERADVILLCGDLTDHGLTEEAEVLATEITSSNKKPVLAVLGNHDYDSGKEKEIRKTLRSAGITTMDGDSSVIHNIGFAGIKGFGGGFDKCALESLGEPSIKHFVREAVDEALKLEAALSTLREMPRVALMHYSPIRATLHGESPEIFPFLGSRRLEEPLNRYEVTAIFHGHAHYGTVEGRTATEIPVFNVAWPLLMKTYRDKWAFQVFEVPVPSNRLTNSEPLSSDG